VAAVDVGTNTVRLMIAEKKPGYLEGDAQSSFDVLKRSFEITRLGEGLGTRVGGEMVLGQEAIDRTINVLTQFKESWKKLGVSDCRVVATSAARDAKNSNDFVDAAKNNGIRVEIISEREEAELALLGIARTVDLSNGTAMTFDVGGGSTEFTLTESGVVVDTLSTDLGVVRLKEMFIAHDPPLKNELK
jgi:exopolyphosphatase / guanosine-5'-triphosphate,3'-diphosphate pyrophosphatase